MDSALQAIFLKGLALELKDELVVHDERHSLNSLIDLAICIDNRIRKRAREQQGMQTGRFRTSTQFYSPDSFPRSPAASHCAQEQLLLPADKPVQDTPHAACSTSCACTVRSRDTIFPAVLRCQSDGVPQWSEGPS